MENIGIRIIAALLLLITPASEARLTSRVACLRRDLPTDPRFTPTVFKQCLEAIRNHIIVDSKMAMVPQHFSRIPGKGFTVPCAWHSGNCVIQIDMHSATEEDTLSLSDIAVQAGLINVGW